METLVMPVNYVELQEDEMMYLDGGLSLPNSVVAFGANAAINAAMVFFTGGGGGFAVFKATIKAVGYKRFTRYLRNSLTRFIGIQAANRISGTLIGFIFDIGGLSIGDVFAKHLDSGDKHPNNGWWDIT